MQYFNGIRTQKGLHARWRQLVKKYHPDRNPDPNATRITQEINSQYAKMASIIAEIDETRRAAEAHAAGRTVKSDEYNLNEIAAEMRAVILAILNISPELKIEITGLWIWVSGDTKPHKDALKKLGLRWASRKKRWYFAGVPSSGRGKWSMSDIRNRYGSATLEDEKKALTA